MKLEDGCYSLKLECALRDLGFVDIGWKCVAHAGVSYNTTFSRLEPPPYRRGDLKADTQ